YVLLFSTSSSLISFSLFSYPILLPPRSTLFPYTTLFRSLKEVQSGKFARQWIRENAAGRANYQRLLHEDVDRQIEKVGAALRARMPWLNEIGRASCRERV